MKFIKPKLLIALFIFIVSCSDKQGDLSNEDDIIDLAISIDDSNLVGLIASYDKQQKKYLNLLKSKDLGQFEEGLKKDLKVVTYFVEKYDNFPKQVLMKTLLNLALVSLEKGDEQGYEKYITKVFLIEGKARDKKIEELLTTYVREWNVEAYGRDIKEFENVLNLIKQDTSSRGNRKGSINKSETMYLLNAFNVVKKAVIKYRLKNGKFPEKLGSLGLESLKDPWGSPYLYNENKNYFHLFELVSLGYDRIKSNDDIIINNLKK